MLTLKDIQSARERIAPHIVRTPLLRVPALDDLLGCEVYLKPENLQYTGSFKLRGALSRLLTLTEEEKKRGVVCASSGNHAQGVAYGAQKLGINALIVMPSNCNPVKLQGVESYGAQAILAGTKSSERDAKVAEIIEKEGRTEIHPFSNFEVKAGQGTMGLEILEDQPDLDVVVVPIGGGGMISGIATAVKSLKSEIQVIGMEPAGAPRYTKSREAGHPIKLDEVNTIADGTRTDAAHPQNFPIIEKYVDHLITIEDDWIKKAMKVIISHGKIVVEPSSVMGIGAALAGTLPVNRTNKVCFVLSGGNNDLNQLAEILSQS